MKVSVYQIEDLFGKDSECAIYRQGEITPPAENFSPQKNYTIIQFPDDMTYNTIRKLITGTPYKESYKQVWLK